MRDEELLRQWFQYSKQDPIYQNELPPGELKNKAESIEKTFTAAVTTLAHVPIERVRLIATLAYDIIGTKLVKTVLGFGVKSLSFAVVKSDEDLHAMILVPPNWDEMVVQHSLLQLGAVLCVCSRSVDFINDKFNPGAIEEISERASTLEAELFRWIFKEGGTPSPFMHEYHRALLSQYPLGITSPKGQALLYTPKGVIRDDRAAQG